MTSDLVEELKRMLVNDLAVEVPRDAIGADDGLRGQLGLDSVGFLELRTLCERRYGIRIGDDDFTPENFGTLASVARLVTRLSTLRTDR